MAKIMKRVALFTTVMTILLALLYRNTDNGLLLTLTITFGTVSYHFTMFLLVGYWINCLFDNRVDY